MQSQVCLMGVAGSMAVVKVARSSREAHGTEASMGVGNLAHFMHKIALFH